MTIQERRSIIWSTGLAMFSMFFGAGNIVFPLALGQFTQDKNFYAVLGMIITGVIVPLVGILAMLLYGGNYEAFFRRIGKMPGFLLTVLILGLIGPLGGIPRCITISYSTLVAFGLEGIKGINLALFSLISCMVIFLFTFRPNKILSLLGYVLTPILLISLGIIVVKGTFSMPELVASMHSRWETFSQGLIGGYSTMDLLAAFFFSSVVIVCLRKDRKQSPEEMHQKNERPLFKIALFSSLIAAILLAIFYVSFSYLAAGYSHELKNVSSELLLGTLAYQLLGPYAGLIAGVAVTFACITTEIALTAVFAEFLRKTIAKEKMSYTTCLIITLAISFLISTLQFQGISAFLGPILQVFYPALIVLTLLNILYKMYDFKPVKFLFYSTVLICMIAYLF